MDIHDAHCLALLVIALGGEGQIEPGSEQQHRHPGKPRQDSRRQGQKPGRIGKIAEFSNGQTVFAHDGSLTLKRLLFNEGATITFASERHALKWRAKTAPALF